ncbi:hypothetical protein FRB99_005449 [Tulasnella sp. 403]|nr:hypothetical protein FRB99_005449 [Tulasnella sp. 403]
MAPSRAISISPTHTLLDELTDSVDSLPHDLTKAFGDLRELDAVLRTSMQAITSKIYRLIELMQNPATPPAARLCLLIEIAEDAQRLRLGSEDKIRVAGKTADDVAAHNQHNQQVISLLASLDSVFQPLLYIRRTTYPHVAPSNLVAPSLDSALSIGRRRRVPTASAANHANAYSTGGIGGRGGANGALSTPMAVSGSVDKTKKRRLDDDDLGSVVRRTPKGKEKDRNGMDKDRDLDGSKDQNRRPAKKARTTQQRSPSPSDDRDVRNGQTSTRHNGNRNFDHHASSQQPPQSHPDHRLGSNGFPHASSSQLHQSHKSRTSGGHQSYPHPPNDAYHGQTREQSTSSHLSGHPGGQHHSANGYNVNGHAQLLIPNNMHGMNDRRLPKSTGTSSLLDVVANRTAPNGTADYGNIHGPAAFDEDDYEVMDHLNPGSSRGTGRDDMMKGSRATDSYASRNGANGYVHPRDDPSRIGPAGVSGPGLHSTESMTSINASGSGVGDAADGDERTYCYCDRVSFGEMIGCDDENCNREWFHLSCLNMSAPPKGEWFCNECRARRESQKPSKKPSRSRARVQTSNANGSTNSPSNGVNGARASVPPPPARSGNAKAA